MPKYTPEQVDTLIVKFEKAADKQISKAPEDVANVDKEFLKPMFCGAEVSLMSVAEEVRDICAMAVMGTTAADRDYLDDVFGRGCNCTRFNRLRAVMDKVVLSQMSCHDPRWKQVADKITTVEEILSQRGSFKPPAVKAPEPKGLSYPKVNDLYEVGEEVNLAPTLAAGEASSFSISGELPAGLSFDTATGAITGTAKAPCAEKAFTITATNASGSTSSTLKFGIAPPPPTGLKYGSFKGQYTVGDEIKCAPEVEGGECTSFSVEPSLPPGMSLDSSTGVISGSPTTVVAATTFQITASNARGKTSCPLKLEVGEPETALIQKIIETTTAKDCLALDPGSDNLLTWMVWMVHRAHLDDDSLEEINFTDLSMPPPATQVLVQPKLMKALQKNTHLATLKLPSSNLFRESVQELADALKVNKTMKFLDISNNDVDAECVKACATKLMENPGTVLQTWFMGHQQSAGNFFGSSCEYTLMNMMKDNMSITKLGVSITDVACRDNIDRYIIRNADRARKLAKGETEEAERVLEEKATSAVRLFTAPATPAEQLFADEVVFFGIVRAFCVEKGQLPTNEQLQAFAKGRGTTVPFAKVAPIMKAFLQKLLDAAVGLRVGVHDAYGGEQPGLLREWKEHKGSWNFVVKKDEGDLQPFSSKKQPPIKVDGELIGWIAP